MIKKIITLIIISSLFILNTNALTVKEQTYSFMISHNGNITKLKKLTDQDGNALFRLKNEDMSYSDLVLYNDTIKGSISSLLTNKIGNIIKAGYIDHNKENAYYYFTQALIFRIYYNDPDIYFCSSNGFRLTIYDDMLKKIEDSIKLEDKEDLLIDLGEELTLDNNYIYDLSNFDNSIPGTYTISYMTKGSLSYYYGSGDRYLFNSTTTGSLTNEFKVKVDGIKLIIDDYYKEYELYDNEEYLGKLKDIKYLKADYNYIIKYNNNIKELNTTNEDYILKREDLSNKEDLSNIEDLNTIEVFDNIENPKTSDNIFETFLIFVSISIIYILLYVRYRRNC